MIQTDQQFEAALEAAMQALETPPEADTPAHERLMALFRDIAAHRPRVRAARTATADREGERLTRRLDAFEAKVLPRYSEHWSPLLGGDIRADRG